MVNSQDKMFPGLTFIGGVGNLGELGIYLKNMEESNNHLGATFFFLL